VAFTLFASNTFADAWPIKPDVVFEGGNVVKNAKGEIDFPCPDLSLLSTYFKPADKSFVLSWGSFVFVGNTDHNVPYMLKNSDLFEALPKQFHDSAFIDRLHAYLPGWEVDVIRGDMFTAGYGFIVDYLAEILRHLRADDFSHRFEEHFRLGPQISTRDRDAIYKTMSGLMKLLFPAGGETADEVEELLRLAVESRKRVKDQLARIDSTYPDVDFHFTGSDGRKRPVTTVEEEEFPQFYHLKPVLDLKEQAPPPSSAPTVASGAEPASPRPTLPSAATPLASRPSAAEGHHVFPENRKGVSFEKLFAPYLAGARQITITDPYIRLFYQVRNVMELIELVLRQKAPEDQVSIHLITGPDEGTLHARHIVTETGWKISLDRGLDIFQQYPLNDAFSLANRMQEQRAVKQFEVTYLRIAEGGR
jgi:ATP-dependent Lon protease